MLNDKYDKAVSAYRNYLLFNESTLEVHLEVARLYKKLGQPSRALNHYRICQQLEPENESVEYEAFSLQMEIQHLHPNQDEHIDNNECRQLNDDANKFLLMEKPEEALKKLEEAIKIDDSYYSLWNNVGMSYHKQGEYQTAIEAYSNALKIKSDYAVGMYNLATTFIKLENYEYAAEFLEGSIELDDGDADVWYNLGFCHMQQKQFEKSIPCFLEVLEIKSNYHAAAFSIAQAYSELRNEKMTLHFLKMIFDVRPEWIGYVYKEPAFEWIVGTPGFLKATGS